MKDFSQGYTWYPKDWASSETIEELTWNERGVYRELLDKAYMNKNKIPIKKKLWSKKWGLSNDDLQYCLDSLNDEGLIEVGEKYITIPSVDKRMEKYLKSSLGAFITNLKKQRPHLDENHIKGLFKKYNGNLTETLVATPTAPPNAIASTIPNGTPHATPTANINKNKIENKVKDKQESVATSWTVEQKIFIDKLSQEHRDFWHVREGENTNLFTGVWTWINSMNKDQILYLSNQLKFYKKIVSETGRFKCTLPTWMEGKWNEANYSDEYGQKVPKVGPKKDLEVSYKSNLSPDQIDAQKRYASGEN